MQRARHQKTEGLQQLEDETRHAVAAVKAEALAPFWQPFTETASPDVWPARSEGTKAEKAKKMKQASEVARFMSQPLCTTCPRPGSASSSPRPL